MRIVVELCHIRCRFANRPRFKLCIGPSRARPETLVPAPLLQVLRIEVHLRVKGLYPLCHPCDPLHRAFHGLHRSDSISVLLARAESENLPGLVDPGTIAQRAIGDHLRNQCLHVFWPRQLQQASCLRNRKRRVSSAQIQEPLPPQRAWELPGDPKVAVVLQDLSMLSKLQVDVANAGSRRTERIRYLHVRPGSAPQRLLNIGVYVFRQGGALSACEQVDQQHLLIGAEGNGAHLALAGHRDTKLEQPHSLPKAHQARQHVASVEEVLQDVLRLQADVRRHFVDGILIEQPRTKVLAATQDAQLKHRRMQRRQAPGSRLHLRNGLQEQVHGLQLSLALGGRFHQSPHHGREDIFVPLDLLRVEVQQKHAH
mmetsp:Transcript_18485/g.69928  ORF Transcript_18485/g.69928 Transcript_18485/m.69928 type:complete len:370 (+) Transcript_18485:313-1422(+)